MPNVPVNALTEGKHVSKHVNFTFLFKKNPSHAGEEANSDRGGVAAYGVGRGGAWP